VAKDYKAIYCIACEGKVQARLTDGKEVYPHRKDLAALPFWKCDKCGNFVGCHYKTEHPTNPLGTIATPEVKKLRVRIHNVLDGLWKRGEHTRGEIYAMMRKRCGWNFHTAKIRSEAEAMNCLSIATNIAQELGSGWED